MSPSIQADMRIYVFTYRRHDLLPRAVNSLLRQTHENWICELHNDDPNDSFPEELVARTNDPRIRYVLHAQNLGAVGSFNLAFQSVCEPYVSILEDDNWWEPDFLATMLRLMEQYPQVSVAWANMWLSQEMGDGTWQRNGSIWPVTTEDEIQEFLPPDARQVCGALHSNGAMLVRVSEATMFTVPKSQPFFAIEPVRERAYPGSLLLVRRPLANFALTRASTRGETADQNMQILVLLAQTFLAHANVSGDFHRRIWIACRGSLGHKHRALLVGAILAGRLFPMLKAARLRDLLLVAAWALRHPFRFRALFQARERFPEVFAFLDAASRSRVLEWNLRHCGKQPDYLS
jgi:Glycosyl transferase family 2